MVAENKAQAMEDKVLAREEKIKSEKFQHKTEDKLRQFDSKIDELEQKIEKLREKLAFTNEDGTSDDEFDSPLMTFKKRQFSAQIERIDAMMAKEIHPLQKEAGAIRDLVITEITRYDDSIS